MYFSSIRRIALTGTMLSVAAFAGGCSSIDRLSQIGEQPKLSAIENPTTQPGYKPVQMPMPVRAPSSRISARIRSAIS